MNTCQINNINKWQADILQVLCQSFRHKGSFGDIYLSVMISLTDLAIILCIAGTRTSRLDTEVVIDDTSATFNESGNSSAIPEEYPDPIFFGILHTLNNFSEWAAKEEEIVDLLRKRLPILEREVTLIKIYLEDYQSSTGKAMEGLKDPRDTPSERGKVVGSSAVLGHRMASRYSSTLARIRELVSSQEYSQNREDIWHLLLLDDIPQGKQTIPSTNVGTDRKIYLFPNTTLNLSMATVGNSTQNETLLQAIYHYERVVANPHRWPNWADKYMSALSFLTILKIYGYQTYDLKEGLEFDTTNPGSLNALQCAELGMFALYRKVYYVAIEWLEVARGVLLYERNDSSIQLDLVESLLKVALLAHNDGMKNEDGTQDNYYLKEVYDGQHPPNRVRRSKGIFRENFKNGHEDGLFLALCSSGPFVRPEYAKKLKCYYERRHPYLYINPIKTEELSLNPPTKQFYEILGNGTIEKIKKLSEPDLELSQLVGANGLENITDFRTSVGTFLGYYEVPEVFKISEYVTGLELKNSSEASQVVEYTYGRYCGWHSDAFGNETKTMETVALDGDRLATMLFHLELPVLGGRTPLCSAGIFAHQIRGSAILWYNMFRNGTVRNDVAHGACPVVHGHKIIVNNWIRYNGNWGHYKCSRDQFDETSF